VSESREQDRAPEEIRRDIRETRGNMDRTVDELVDRFSVGSLVDEAWRRMRHSGGDGMDVGGMLREHPVPIALVGLGLGWLAVEQASGRSMSTEKFGSGSGTTRTGRTSEADGDRSGARRRDRFVDGAGQPTDTHGPSEGHGHSDGDDFTDKVSDKASEAMASAGESVSNMRESVSDMKESASDMKERAQAAGKRTRAGFQELLSENPLTIGSIVFGLGLASGLAVPTSDLEDREMGAMSDRVKSKARHLGSDAAHRAAEVGREVVDTAVSETSDQVDDLRHVVEEEPAEKS